MAEDHRGEDAADRRREEGQLEQEPDGRSAAPRQRAEDQDEQSGRQRDEPGVARDRTAAQHERSIAPIRTNAARAARRGASNAGFATTGESPSVAGSDPSENHASTPNSSAQIVVNRTNPGVADVRQRASSAIAYAPTASPVSTVQLM